MALVYRVVSSSARETHLFPLNRHLGLARLGRARSGRSEEGLRGPRSSMQDLRGEIRQEKAAGAPTGMPAAAWPRAPSWLGRAQDGRCFQNGAEGPIPTV